MRIKLSSLKGTIITLMIIVMLTASNSITSGSANLAESNSGTDFKENWFWTSTEIISQKLDVPFRDVEVVIDHDLNAHFVWWNEAMGSYSDWDIFYRKWIHDSQIWTTPEIVSTGFTNLSQAPNIAVGPDGTVHVVWQDTSPIFKSGNDLDVFYKSRNPTTNLWSTPVVISNESDNSSNIPLIRLDSQGNIHVIWTDKSDFQGSGEEYDIFYRRWEFKIGNWTSTEVLTPDSSVNVYCNDFVIDKNDKIHLTYYTLGDYKVFYKNCDTRLDIWYPTEQISDNDSLAGNPRIAVNSKMVPYVVYYERPNGSPLNEVDIYSRSYDIQRGMWNNAVEVSSESTNRSGYPSITIDPFDNVHVIWEEWPFSGFTDRDIFSKSWDSESETWLPHVLVSTSSFQTSDRPEVTSDRLGFVHVAWRDTTPLSDWDSNSSIFYKKFLGPPSSPILNNIDKDGVDNVILHWDPIPSAKSYLIYESPYPITLIDSPTPIAEVETPYYVDSSVSEGLHYYAIVASNYVGSSVISNQKSVFIQYASTEISDPIITTEIQSTTATSTNDDSESTTAATPGLELLLVAISLVLFAIWKRKHF